jgi:predicted ATPase
MRIMWLRARNYRALQDVSWGTPKEPLRRRTVVFGANGSGKSSLLRAVDLLLNEVPRHLYKSAAKLETEILNEAF